MGKLLIFIFVIALAVRFLYFPDNIYFGFDQARDAFESLDIYKNFNLKIIGPSTAAENLFHGPLYWYLIGSFYLLGGGNPQIPAAFLSILNALGVFIIFWIGRRIFNPMVGIMAAFLYAISFEQTQYALYFGNPAPAVLTMMLFYAGLMLLFFEKKWVGLPTALFFLGLSIQFEFFIIYLLGVMGILIIIFGRRVIRQLTFPQIIISLGAFLVAISTFVIADLKFNFRTIKTLLNMTGNSRVSNFSLTDYFDKLIRHINDNILSANLIHNNYTILQLLLIGLIIYVFYLIFKKKDYRREFSFLTIWFLSGIFLFAFGTPRLYYSNIGISPALLLISAFLISKVYTRKKILAIVLLIVILTSNLTQVLERNKEGIINDIYVQEGMLLGREKQALDFIYTKAEHKPIVVSALTMPLKINTTWAYLFNWYGGNKYHYLPFWAGEAALGYPGFLPTWKSQEKDYIMFSIIEPTRGVRYAFIEQYLKEQEQYGKVFEEKILGDKWTSQLIVQLRK
ncbi:glycosyltransferase family 39 protein [Candidatus Microgenomates bacterium]|nr:glycosyltransferase family 39 protein [Candidatus Microgenomates bacterium]